MYMVAASLPEIERERKSRATPLPNRADGVGHRLVENLGRQRTDHPLPGFAQLRSPAYPSRELGIKNAQFIEIPTIRGHSAVPRRSRLRRRPLPGRRPSRELMEVSLQMIRA